MGFLFKDSGDKHAKKGLEAVDQGNFQKAISELEAALAKGVKAYKKHELLAILGRAYNRVGDLEKAISVCQQAIQLQENYPAAWNNMGIAYIDLGKMAEAEACYRKAIELDPTYTFAHASLGALYIRLGQPGPAKVVLEQAIALNPNLNVAHGNLALALAMLGEFDRANAALKQAIALGYTTWREVAARIQALAASPQLYAAPEPAAALEPDPNFPFLRFPTSDQANALTQSADERMANGQRREAINLYKQALSVEPNASYVLVRCALALHEEGRIADAIQYCTLALKIDPDYGLGYYARGWAKHALKDYQGELDDARRGSALDPQNPGPYLRRIGAALTGLRQYNEALAAYAQAIELHPNDEGTLYNMGLCYWEMGDYRKAIDAFTRALQLDPDWDWALLNRAKAYLKLGERQQALNDVNEVLRLHPNHEQALQLRTALQ